MYLFIYVFNLTAIIQFWNQLQLICDQQTIAYKNGIYIVAVLHTRRIVIPSRAISLAAYTLQAARPTE
jgi:regulator of sirC expression with transglutaminase-like and TPR domain